MKFQTQKAYSIEYKEKDSTYWNKVRWLCIELYNDKVVILNSVYDDWFNSTVEIPLDSEINASEIMVEDFAEEYISNVEKDIEKHTKKINDAKLELNKRIKYINNRSFLGKVQNYIKDIF